MPTVNNIGSLSQIGLSKGAECQLDVTNASNSLKRVERTIPVLLFIGGVPDLITNLYKHTRKHRAGHNHNSLYGIRRRLSDDYRLLCLPIIPTEALRLRRFPFPRERIQHVHSRNNVGRYRITVWRTCQRRNVATWNEIAKRARFR